MRHASIDYSNLDTVDENPRAKPQGNDSALSERKSVAHSAKVKIQINEASQSERKFDLSNRIQAKDHPAFMGKKAPAVSS